MEVWFSFVTWGVLRFGAENYDTSLKFSGGDAVGLGVQQLRMPMPVSTACIVYLLRGIGIRKLLDTKSYSVTT